MVQTRRQSAAHQVAAKAAAAVTGSTRRTVKVRRSTSPTPPSLTPGYSVDGSRNLRLVPGTVHVVVYEGPHMFALERHLLRLQDLCIGTGAAVGGGYVEGHFKSGRNGLKDNSVFTMVAVKEVHGQRLIVGYAQCTLYSTLKTIRTPRVVKIDLLCTQGENPNDRLKGAGSILMKELHLYAKYSLGANMLVLDSVSDRPTWEFYKKWGFTRTTDQCNPPPGEREKAAANFKTIAQGRYGLTRHHKHHRGFWEGSDGLFFHDWNTVLKNENRPRAPKRFDTLFMSKCLNNVTTDGKHHPVKVTYPQTGGPATFVEPRVHVLAVFGTPGPTLVKSEFGTPDHAVPNILGPGTPPGQTPGRKRRLSSVSPSRIIPNATPSPQALGRGGGGRRVRTRSQR